MTKEQNDYVDPFKSLGLSEEEHYKLFSAIIEEHSKFEEVAQNTALTKRMSVKVKNICKKIEDDSNITKHLILHVLMILESIVIKHVVGDDSMYNKLKDALEGLCMSELKQLHEKEFLRTEEKDNNDNIN